MMKKLDLAVQKFNIIFEKMEVLVHRLIMTIIAKKLSHKRKATANKRFCASVA